MSQLLEKNPNYYFPNKSGTQMVKHSIAIYGMFHFVSVLLCSILLNGVLSVLCVYTS